MPRAELEATEMVTPPVRLSFPALFEPKPVMKGSETLKYMATLLIPEDVDLAPFIACIKAAMMTKWGKVIKMPARNNPLKACNEKELDGYEEDWHYINAKSQYAPNVVDQGTEPVIERERVYAGCWCRFHIQAFAWAHEKGGKGVSFSLSAVQLVKDDDRLDGRKTAQDVFEPLDNVAEADEIEDSSDDDLAALFG